METKIKNQLIKSAKTIRNKAKRLRKEEEDFEIRQRKIFKPITDPLNSLRTLKHRKDKLNPVISCEGKDDDENDDDNDDNDYDDHQNSFTSSIYEDTEAGKIEKNEGEIQGDNLPSHHITEKINSSLLVPTNEYKNLNVPFGIRRENKKLMIGNKNVMILDSKQIGSHPLIKIDDEIFEMTLGLKELLFQSKPDLKIVSERDKLLYKDILNLTSAHKRDFDPSNQIKGDKGIKYCKLIRPLFLKESKGGSLPVLKQYHNNTDFVYWDDPNELIERLKLLIASKDAGNNSHDNEIISIIEELKESGIIKE